MLGVPEVGFLIGLFRIPELTFFLFSYFFFFFSSRRRHTRYWRDWSSDVCSSDLLPQSQVFHGGQEAVAQVLVERHAARQRLLARPDATSQHHITDPELDKADRSEERRVGKECRSRW